MNKIRALQDNSDFMILEKILSINNPNTLNPVLKVSYKYFIYTQMDLYLSLGLRASLAVGQFYGLYTGRAGNATEAPGWSTLMRQIVTKQIFQHSPWRSNNFKVYSVSIQKILSRLSPGILWGDILTWAFLLASFSLSQLYIRPMFIENILQIHYL